VNETLLASLDAGLGDVEDAMQRLQEGTYGRGDEGGRRGPDERLETVPTTRYCAEHARDARP
jgi:DnaK suppressor protein